MGLPTKIEVRGGRVHNLKNIDVDIVLAKQNDDGSIRITSDKNHTWIDSNCLKQIDYITEQNQTYGFGYKKLMKLFKYLNKEILNNKIKSPKTINQLL